MPELNESSQQGVKIEIQVSSTSASELLIGLVANQLAQYNELTPEQRAQNPDIQLRISELQNSITQLKKKLISRGLTEQQARQRITGILDKSGIKYQRKDSSVPDAAAARPQVLPQVEPSSKVEARPTTETSKGALTTDEIRKISSDAAGKIKILKRIGELEAWIKLGFGMQVQQARESLDQERDLYKQNYGELPTGEDLPEAMKKMPREVGLRFDAHGIAKGNNFDSLINLLTNGVDQTRPFSSMSLIEDMQAAVAAGAASPYTDGGIIVVGPVKGRERSSADEGMIVDRQKKTTNIQYVVLGQRYYSAIPRLEQAFPKVKFVKASEMAQVLGKEVLKADAKA